MLRMRFVSQMTLPPAPGLRSDVRSRQVCLRSSPAVPRDGCPVARPSPRSRDGVSCIMRVKQLASEGFPATASSPLDWTSFDVVIFNICGATELLRRWRTRWNAVMSRGMEEPPLPPEVSQGRGDRGGTAVPRLGPVWAIS
jgi:hypothetical protein